MKYFLLADACLRYGNYSAETGSKLDPFYLGNLKLNACPKIGTGCEIQGLNGARTADRARLYYGGR